MPQQQLLAFFPSSLNNFLNIAKLDIWILDYFVNDLFRFNPLSPDLIEKLDSFMLIYS